MGRCDLSRDKSRDSGSDTEQSLGAALRERRGERTLAEFSQLLGISTTLVSKIETGDRHPGLTKGARCILRVYPELAPFFLPANIIGAIEPSRE